MLHLLLYIIRNGRIKIKHNEASSGIFWHKGGMVLGNSLIYPVGNTAACRYAALFLKKAGVRLVDHPTPEVTHLLLDVPSFGADGKLRGGGDVEEILRMLPPKITVVGGNLSHPALAGYKTMDLLKDAQYLAVNAAITADCALRVAAPKMTATFADSPALVIGWGRIGKCLGQLLTGLGTEVTFAARKEADRAMIKALHFEAVDMDGMAQVLPKCRLIFNTAPEMVVHKALLALCENAVKIDLASKLGMEGEDVIWARGLPGIHAPESSGKLIAETFMKLDREE